MYEIDEEGFVDRLRQALDSTNLSDAEISRRLGFSKYSMTKFNKGRIPKAKILFSIAQMCNTTIEWLLTGKEPKITSQNPEIDELIEAFKSLPKEDIDRLRDVIEFLQYRRNKKKTDNSPPVQPSNTTL